VKNIEDTNIGTVPAEGVVGAAGHEAALLEDGVQYWRQWLTVIVLISSDTLLAFLSWGVGSALRSFWELDALSLISVGSIVPATAVWVGARALLGLYPGYGLNSAEELRRQTFSVLATLAATATFALVVQMGSELSRMLYGMSLLVLLIVAPLVRYFVKFVLMKLRLWGWPVIILGAGEPGAQLVRTLQREWGLGFRPIAVFDFRPAPAGGLLEGVPYRGTMIDALALARRHNIDTAIFAMPSVSPDQLARLIGMARYSLRHIIVMSNLWGVTNSGVVARDLAGNFGVELKHNLLNPWALRTKRMLDLVATILGGALILPLLIGISLIIWLDSRGGVFYTAQRMGQDGKLFSCLKFRTMLPDAEVTLERMLKESAEMREEYLKYHKLRDDPRVTRIGRFLRRTSLDELPQLWNVLRGEMSLVGPRPYLPRESEDIGPMQSEILRVPPGITGSWQVTGRNGISFTERVQLDDYYVRNWSVWLDLIILARTVRSVVFDRGVY